MNAMVPAFVPEGAVGGGCALETTNEVKYREVCIAGTKHSQNMASPAMRMHNSAATAS